MLFSISIWVSAKGGYIEELLEYGEGPEAFEINTVEVQNLAFENAAVQKKYNDYKKTVSALKTALLQAYANEELEYYQMQGIIKNFNNFVYHTNLFFFYISEKEKYSEEKDLANAILRNYKLSRSYFKKIKNLYNN